MIGKTLAEIKIESIRKLMPEVFRLLYEFKRAIQFSSWLIAVTLAVLGFFITVLIQIKLQSKLEIPYSQIAILSLLTLCISIVIGVYIKIRYELGKLIRKMEKSIIDLLSFIEKPESNEYFNLIVEPENVIEECKTKIRETFSFSNGNNSSSVLYPIIVQGVLFAGGVVLVCTYVFLYLFHC